MSLNIWFRDYLFYPIVRSRWVNGLRKRIKEKSKKFAKIIPSIVGMAIVWPLIGLWHGASLNYILHGSCYGLLMIWSLLIENLCKRDIKTGKMFDVLRTLRTLLITIVLLVLFRMPNLNGVFVVFSRIVMFKSGISYIYTWSLIFIPIVMGISIYAYIKNNGNGYYLILDLTKFRNKVIFCTVAMLTVIFMYVGENYFMYFQF